jgi:hypothetical protein
LTRLAIFIGNKGGGYILDELINKIDDLIELSKTLKVFVEHKDIEDAFDCIEEMRGDLVKVKENLKIEYDKEIPSEWDW